MAKDIKIGVRAGDGEPEYQWNVFLLDLAFRESMGFMDESQYCHASEQVRELARENDPSHPQTQDVDAVEDFFELRDKGGPLCRINLRVFFILDKLRRAIVVLGAIDKKNQGRTTDGDKKRIKRRMRKYFAGEYGFPELGSGHGGGTDDRVEDGKEDGTS